MKKPLLIGIIAVLGLMIAWFAINVQSESKSETTTNPYSQSIHIDGYSETDYEIIESSNQSCSEDKECETPNEYLIRSSCPYTSKCIQNICTVVCPNFDNNQEKQK